MKERLNVRKECFVGGVIICCLFALLMITIPAKQVKAATKTYTITTKSKPLKKKYFRYSNYTKYTRQYFAIRDRLERLEKSKGGTLILKKGSYNITNVLYIPSNVTIILRDGATLSKGKKTGAKGYKASGTMMQFVKPSKAAKKHVYGKYNGMKNISIIGEGKATINLNYYKKGIGIVTGHNQNINITGITFRNSKSGHFIEMDATKDIKVTNCKFTNGKFSGEIAKEGINLDTPDKVTKGFTHDWSKYDKTPNYNVLIEDCSFNNLGRSIGTHQYSGGKYHTKVVVNRCYIYGMHSDAMRILNWRNCTITNNTIEKTRSGKKGISGGGIEYITIENNTFKNIKDTAVLFAPSTNSVKTKYPITYNKFSNENYTSFANNVGINVTSNYVKIAKKYKNFYTKDSIIINLKTS